MESHCDNFNEDELEAPEWLNVDFITKVLCQWAKNGDITVNNIKFTPGTGKGDHYGSIMFRAVVQYQQQGREKTKSMIIKTMPEVEGHKKELLSELNVFDTEIGIYSEVLPKIEAILRAVGDQTVLGAEMIYYSVNPITLIIFEDLVALGYCVIRGRSITLDEVKGSYLKLAKWHAVGYKLLLENPHIFDKYKRGGLMSVAKERFMVTGIENFIELLGSEQTLLEYKPYFESIRTALLPRCIAIFKEYYENPLKDTWYVLSHGDFHEKNLMFKRNPKTGGCEDVMPLDFQMCYSGPIVTDLIYSYIVLLSSEQRLNNFHELIKFYFDIFLDTLKQIGFDKPLPTFEDLMKQWKRYRYYEIFLLVTFLPLFPAFKAGKVDPAVIITNDEYRKNVIYKDKELVVELQKLLPHYKRLGYFDFEKCCTETDKL